MKYRSEIDGLRALAVVPVILFHAGFELFSGGFVGVDVFFVISGYLITTILIDDIENKRFSIVRFYERRARRILPALFFMMLVCLPFAWRWMLDSEFLEFSKSLIAVSFFASNFLFARSGGYFDTAVEEKPLLHTWSLAVEEQYYVLFPIFLLLAWRFGKSRVFWLIVGMAAVSLAFGEWGVRHSPNKTFYHTGARAWELFAGSIAAFLVQKRGVRANDPLAFTGLAAILFAIFSYNGETPFPSVYTLLPVWGVVLLVLYAGPGSLAARFLGAKPFVSIGLISYSAYLWHQPMFAFARLHSEDGPSIWVMLLLAFASLGVGYLSWRFIETPVRAKVIFHKRRSIFAFSLAGILLFAAVGGLGTKHFVTSYAASFYTAVYGGDGYQWEELAKSGKPSILLTGDSHAKQYYGALQNTFGETSLIGVSACLSLPGVINEYRGQAADRTECADLYKRVLDYYRANPSITTLIFANRYNKGLYDIKTSQSLGLLAPGAASVTGLITGLEDFIAQFPPTLNIILIGNVPSAHVASRKMRKGMQQCLVLAGKSECPTSYDKKLREQGFISADLAALADRFPNVHFVDPGDYLCEGATCRIVVDDQLIYSDHSHLTKFGADLVVTGMAHDKNLNFLKKPDSHP